MAEHVVGPLAGKRVVVTRRLADAEELRVRLAALGATPICAPVINAVAIANPALDQALMHLIDTPNQVGRIVILSASEESRVATCPPCDGVGGTVILSFQCPQRHNLGKKTGEFLGSASEESRAASRPPYDGVGGDVILSASEESRIATRPPCDGVGGTVILCASEESRVATRTLSMSKSDTTPPPPGAHHYAWLIFTSATAVEFFFARIADLSVQVRLPRVAVVGPATAARLWACAQVRALLPPESTGAALGRALPLAPGDRVLLPRAQKADPQIGAVLCARGALVDDIAIYTTKPIAPPPVALAELARGVDLLTFTSPSTVQAFFAHVAPQQIGSALIACIGPTTARAAQERGLTVAAVAREASTDGLIEALVDLCGNRERETGDG